MTRRLIQTVKNGDNVAKVYRDSEWEEYVVRFFTCGAEQGTGYHTNDKKDALSTAHVMVGL